MKTFKGLLRELPENGVYCFLTNIKGEHLKGPAKVAHELFGAEWGRAFCSMGRSYGICIKFVTEVRVEDKFMKAQIETFYRIAKRDSHKLFYVMYNGAFMANYSSDDMVRIFKSFPIPDNLVFEEEFSKLLTGSKKKIDEMEV